MAFIIIKMSSLFYPLVHSFIHIKLAIAVSYKSKSSVIHGTIKRLSITVAEKHMQHLAIGEQIVS